MVGCMHPMATIINHGTGDEAYAYKRSSRWHKPAAVLSRYDRSHLLGAEDAPDERRGQLRISLSTFGYRKRGSELLDGVSPKLLAPFPSEIRRQSQQIIGGDRSRPGLSAIVICLKIPESKQAVKRGYTRGSLGQVSWRPQHQCPATHPFLRKPKTRALNAGRTYTEFYSTQMPCSPFYWTNKEANHRSLSWFHVSWSFSVEWSAIIHASHGFHSPILSHPGKRAMKDGTEPHEDENREQKELYPGDRGGEAVSFRREKSSFISDSSTATNSIVRGTRVRLRERRAQHGLVSAPDEPESISGVRVADGNTKLSLHYGRLPKVGDVI